MNGLKYMLCPIYNNKTCLSKPGLRIMKIVTENSTGQFITNCMRQHYNAKFNTVYYKLRRYLYMIYFKVLKYISNHFNFQLQIINKLDKLYTKTDMYNYLLFSNPSLYTVSVCSQILHKFLLSKALQEILSPPGNSLYRKRANSVLWGTQIIASSVSMLSYLYRTKLFFSNREQIIIF